MRTYLAITLPRSPSGNGGLPANQQTQDKTMAQVSLCYLLTASRQTDRHVRGAYMCVCVVT